MTGKIPAKLESGMIVEVNRQPFLVLVALKTHTLCAHVLYVMLDSPLVPLKVEELLVQGDLRVPLREHEQSMLQRRASVHFLPYVHDRVGLGSPSRSLGHDVLPKRVGRREEVSARCTRADLQPFERHARTHLPRLGIYFAVV